MHGNCKEDGFIPSGRPSCHHIEVIASHEQGPTLRSMRHSSDEPVSFKVQILAIFTNTVCSCSYLGNPHSSSTVPATGEGESLHRTQILITFVRRQDAVCRHRNCFRTASSENSCWIGSSGGTIRILGPQLSVKDHLGWS